MREKFKLTIKIVIVSLIFTGIFYEIFLMRERLYPIKASIKTIEISDSEKTYEEIENFEHMLLNIVANVFKTEKDEKWSYDYNAPKNEELFGECFRNPEKFYQLKNKNIFNEKSLRSIDMLINKCLKTYDGKQVNVITFEYKGEEIRFPIGLGITR